MKNWPLREQTLSQSSLADEKGCVHKPRFVQILASQNTQEYIYIYIQKMLMLKSAFFFLLLEEFLAKWASSHPALVLSWPEMLVYACLRCTFAGEAFVSAARATTGKAEKWVIYMPTEQSGSNLHASCSAFHPRQQIKPESGGVGVGTCIDEDHRRLRMRDKNSVNWKNSHVCI